MAEPVSDIIGWLQGVARIKPDALIGVNDDGLALEVVGNPGVYYEIGGIPLDDEEEDED